MTAVKLQLITITTTYSLLLAITTLTENIMLLEDCLAGKLSDEPAPAYLQSICSLQTSFTAFINQQNFNCSGCPCLWQCSSVFR